MSLTGSVGTGLGNVPTTGQPDGAGGGGGGGGGFGADVTVQLNNTTPAAVNAWRSVISLSSGVPGSEASQWEVSLLSGGAPFVAMHLDSAGWMAVGGSVVNIGGNPAGTTGITLVGSGTNTGLIETKMTTTSVASKAIGQWDAFNGATKTAILQAHNESAVNGGQWRFFVGSGLTLAATIAASGITFSVATTCSTTLNVGANIVFNGGSAQHLSKSGNTLFLETTDANGINISTNNVVRVSIGSAGQMGFFGAAAVAQQTVGAVTNNVTSGGVNGTIADFTSLTVYSTDAATIRNDIFQLARSVAQLATAMRNYGLGA